MSRLLLWCICMALLSISTKAFVKLSKTSDFQNTSKSDLIFNVIANEIEDNVDRKFEVLIDKFNEKMDKIFNDLKADNLLLQESTKRDIHLLRESTKGDIQAVKESIEDMKGSISVLNNIYSACLFVGGSIGTLFFLYITKHLKL